MMNTMKDIGEFVLTIDKMRNQFDEIKRRYDKHAGFKIGLQNNYSHFCSLEKIRKQKICCSSDDIEISTYPFYISKEFARLIHVRCNCCGTCYVPSIDFDLSHYYAKIYASHVQSFRKFYPFYSNDNPFFETSAFERMKKRALKHLLFVNDKESQTLLDIGSGVGLSLYFAKSKTKYAYELDESCHSILQDELNVRMIDIFKDDIHVDGIIASHFLEHLFIEELPIMIDRLYKILNPNGILVVEVPRGGEAISKMKKEKSRYKIMYEPHTISFSTRGLYNIMKKSNFIIKGITHDNIFEGEKLCNNIEDNSLVCICTKK